MKYVELNLFPEEEEEFPRHSIPNGSKEQAPSANEVQPPFANEAQPPLQAGITTLQICLRGFPSPLSGAVSVSLRRTRNIYPQRAWLLYASMLRTS